VPQKSPFLRKRRSAPAVSREAPACFRTLGLITYPLYLTHNVIGTAIIRVLVDAGLDPTSALWVALGMLVLVCWFICTRIEPAIRGAMTQTIAYFGQLPERLPASKRPRFSRGLGLRLPMPAKMAAASQ
jgi:peptidoglycan/LPS O-acetylase OafA/YrhL